MADMTDYHRNACRTLASTSQSQEIRTIAAAISNMNEWLDGNFGDLKRIFGDFDAIKQQIEDLDRRLRSLEAKVR
jgi:hypothetical protein